MNDYVNFHFTKQQPRNNFISVRMAHTTFTKNKILTPVKEISHKLLRIIDQGIYMFISTNVIQITSLCLIVFMFYFYGGIHFLESQCKGIDKVKSGTCNMTCRKWCEEVTKIKSVLTMKCNYLLLIPDAFSGINKSYTCIG